MPRHCLHIVVALSLLLLFGLAGCLPDSSSSEGCDDGTEQCACFTNNTCHQGLSCVEGICLSADSDAGDAGSDSNADVSTPEDATPNPGDVATVDDSGSRTDARDGSTDTREPADTDGEDAQRDAGADTSDTTDTNVPPDATTYCTHASWYDGEMRAGGSTSATSFPPTHDAGLTAVRDAALAGETILTSPLEVRGAVVSATRYSNNNGYWLQDSSGGIAVWLDSGPDIALDVGMTVDFDVLETSLYAGIPQIDEITNFSITGSGSLVYIEDMNTRELVIDDINQIGRLTGVVSNPVPCGATRTCFDFLYAHNSGPWTTTLRVSDALAATFSDSECYVFTGPVSAFNDPQIEVNNLDWIWQLGSP